MRSAAVLVGVDAYAERPLTSAVNDARAVRDTLVQVGLVDPSDVRLLTAPAQDPADLATKANIGAALHSYYSGAAQADRLFCYFAGHGMSVYSDAARSRTCTVVLPVDVRNLDTDGLNLVSVDEVVERMRFRGPAEQFYFVDACRDLAYERHPDPGPLGWSAEPLEATRAQAVLYAVSRLGQAVGQTSGMGVFTSHLLDALRGEGLALDFSEDRDTYVVTPQSVRDHVRQRVEEAVSGLPQWQRRYMLPELHAPDPQPSPLLEIPDPPPVPLTVHIDPDMVADATTVQVWKSRHPLAAPSWPPMANHQPVPLEPQRYTLVASSSAGEAVPERLPIDVRTVSEATIRVLAAAGPPAVAEPAAAARPRLRTAVPPSGPPGPVPHPPPPEPQAVVRAGAEPAVTIELLGQQPPYERHAGMGQLWASVAPGPYEVRFRLGPDVYNTRELFLLPGDDVLLEPTLPTSPLIRELLHPDQDQSDVLVSETIGPFQAGVLETVLPIVGIKPFDLGGELFGRFEGVVPRFDPAALGDRPLSVVVAIDGDGWPVPAAEVARSVSVRLARHDGAPLPPASPLPLATAEEGFARMALVVTTAPAGSFTVAVESPHTGTLTLASAFLEGRATVVTVRFGSDGAIAVSQNLLPLPGRAYAEPVPDVPFGVLLRQLQLGQQLYRSGELAVTARRHPGLEDLMDLFAGKWTDPILGCMAYYALRDAVEAGEDPGITESFAAHVGDNLSYWFGDLPDSRVVHALATAPDTAEALDALLEHDEVPLLARSTSVLARHARSRGREGAAVVDALRRTDDPTWTMWWQAPAAAAKERT